MVVVRDIEPWDALLQAGREDERLVMQASQHPRPAQEVAIPEELHPGQLPSGELRLDGELRRSGRTIDIRRQPQRRVFVVHGS